MKIGLSLGSKVISGGHTHRQTGDLISLLSCLESMLKMSFQRTLAFALFIPVHSVIFLFVYWYGRGGKRHYRYTITECIILLLNVFASHGRHVQSVYTQILLITFIETWIKAAVNINGAAIVIHIRWLTELVYLFRMRVLEHNFNVVCSDLKKKSSRT
jgi:hypothetical protein